MIICGGPAGPSRLLLLVGALCSASCDASVSGDDVDFSSVDSAGVRIVRNVAPQVAGLDTICATPEWIIGDERDGTPLHRVTGVARLSDGRIVVLNSGSSEVLFFAPDARSVTSFGRRGNGPGEFRSLASIAVLPGDTVAVYDRLANRITLISPSVELAASTAVHPTLTGDTRYLGRLADGAHLFSHDVRPTAQMAPGTTVREHGVFVIYGADGMPQRTVLEAPGSEIVPITRGPTVQVLQLPFGKSRVAALFRDTLYVAVSEEFTIRVYDASAGNLIRRLERSFEAERVTPADREPYGTEQFPGLQLPLVKPALRHIHVDRSGRLWVEEYPGPSSSRHWSVFDGSGRWVRSVVVPRELNVHVVTEDHVIVTTRADDDSEQVHVYGLTCGAATTGPPATTHQLERLNTALAADSRSVLRSIPASGFTKSGAISFVWASGATSSGR
jgi:hypothetical protein